jgi:hypothetical protein
MCVCTKAVTTPPLPDKFCLHIGGRHGDGFALHDVQIFEGDRTTLAIHQTRQRLQIVFWQGKLLDTNPLQVRAQIA